MAFYHSRAKLATEQQLACLREMGLNPDRPLSRYEADKLIKENQEAWAKLPPTRYQKGFLVERYLWREGMTRGEATDLIQKVKTSSHDDRYGRPDPWHGDPGRWGDRPP
jgi:hypothetical protein